MKYLSFALLVVSSMMAACSSRQGLMDNIKTAESKLWADSARFEVNQEAAQQAIAAYEKFAASYAVDSLAPEYLFKAAEVNRAIKQFDKAIELWQKIEDKYPAYPKAAHCLFLQGFVYENDLNNAEKAREQYSLFLEKYPQHDLSDDVRFSLQNLGKSPEQIIKEFEQKQKQDTTAVSS